MSIKRTSIYSTYFSPCPHASSTRSRYLRNLHRAKNVWKWVTCTVFPMKSRKLGLCSFQIYVRTCFWFFCVGLGCVYFFINIKVFTKRIVLFKIDVFLFIEALIEKKIKRRKITYIEIPSLKEHHFRPQSRTIQKRDLNLITLTSIKNCWGKEF